MIRAQRSLHQLASVSVRNAPLPRRRQINSLRHEAKVSLKPPEIGFPI
jgi:hypothetical protein